MQIESLSIQSNRTGFLYFPDASHYTSQDLDKWLPILKGTRARWLVLRAESSRAVPEQFITVLINAGIDPILHMPMRQGDAPSASDLRVLLRAYASWGVKHIILFDRPNNRDCWTGAGWSQANLVESFLDRFLPLANESLNCGLSVIFPPLEPGGNYWDVSFLRNCLLAMKRRNQKNLLESLVLSACAYTFGHDLDWGRGGSERWSGNKPYSTPSDSQDQVGFNNYEWLQETAHLTCGRSYPVILLGAGQKDMDPSSILPEEGQKEVVSLINTLADSSILAAAFPLVDVEGELSSIASLLGKNAPKDLATSEEYPLTEDAPSPTSAFLIKHYLLLPSYEWGVSDWHLDAIKPFVRKHQPTVGFSIQEAALAAQVTVIGGEGAFSEDSLTQLRSRGCQVERISGDGTTIATQLSER